MKWACKKSDVGHALEPRAADAATAFSGWMCSHCGTLFADAEESMHDSILGMEPVDVDDGDTDAQNAAAVALQCAASTRQHDIKVGGVPIHHYTNHFEWASWTRSQRALDNARTRQFSGRAMYAEAEALIRTGKV